MVVSVSISSLKYNRARDVATCSSMALLIVFLRSSRFLQSRRFWATLSSTSLSLPTVHRLSTMNLLYPRFFESASSVFLVSLFSLPPCQEGARRHRLAWHEQWLVSSRPQQCKRTRNGLSRRATRRSRGCKRPWYKRRCCGTVATEVGRWDVASCWCRPAAIYSRVGRFGFWTQACLQTVEDPLFF